MIEVPKCKYTICNVEVVVSGAAGGAGDGGRGGDTTLLDALESALNRGYKLIFTFDAWENEERKEAYEAWFGTGRPTSYRRSDAPSAFSHSVRRSARQCNGGRTYCPRQMRSPPSSPRLRRW